MPRQASDTSNPLTRVLVTGGSGFLGGHIVRQLLDDATTTVAIVSRHPKMPVGDTHQSRISIHVADLTTPSQIKAVFEDVKPHAIIHTASPTYLDTTTALVKTNIEGTRALLQASIECSDTRAFVFTSSHTAVMPTQKPLSEDDSELYTENNSPNAYAMSKAVAERMVIAANSPELRTSAIRMPSIWGENDPNFVPQLVASIRKKEHKMQVGNNTKVFEFLYIKKAAEAHILAMRSLLNPESSVAAGEAFFISDGKPHPFFDFSRKFYAAGGHPVAPKEVTTIPLGVMQAMASTVEWAYWIFTLGTIQPGLRRVSIDQLDTGCCWSLEKAKTKLGYEPIVDQDDAIKQTMTWAMANL
ncbi:erg26, C-3 sterol dehydrogenase [Fusarium torreyae]|uniref:Erg26, C-3 sterol dehydrogenase n=1 Tax=Fusarium torreyae TaxID=1237075 RepID=A0A9W8VFD0_9HYPO|nr:erg26, C-3 sterol dehydrogenase [Fusarium torreyae]